MSASWRPPFPLALLAALTLALLPPSGAPGAAAPALDQPALEELEGLLRDLGFDPGPVDGVVDGDTTAAIRRYKDFAVLPGEPEPDRRLLEELRGVAAAFAVLTAGKAEAAAAAPQKEGAPPQEDSAPPPVPGTAPEALPEQAPEKVIVPPPPAPPKLLAPDTTAPDTTAPDTTAPETTAGAATADETTADETTADEPAQTAVLPPAAAVPEPGEPGAAAPVEQAGDPAADLQARIDAELLRFLHRLQDGSITRADLARQFNAEGRQLLQQAQYDEAILKFSVAIHLDPTFAGAYSNRGTAHQRQEQAALAKADFDKAKELGFGGFRAKDGRTPLN